MDGLSWKTFYDYKSYHRLHRDAIDKLKSTGRTRPDRMILGVRVSAPSGNKMDDPTEDTHRSDPGDSKDNHPDDSDKDPPVVDLT
jgi:hypothetical protein